MKRRVYGAAAAAVACLSLAALTGVAFAGNPHGTPPGQEKQDASTSGSPSSSTSSASQTSTQSAPNPQSKYEGCTASDSQGAGVKPNNTTKHFTCARADSNQTKLYGNGKTAGGIAMSRGASGDTKLYGPGNSQPHKVAPCPDKHGRVHYKDVHAVKSYSSTGCQSSSASTSSSTSSSISSSTSSNAASNASGNTSSSTSASTSSSTAATAGPTASSPTNASSGVLGAQATPSKKAASPGSGVLGATTRTGTLPFTGLPLWLPALAAFALLGTGLALRRRASLRP